MAMWLAPVPGATLALSGRRLLPHPGARGPCTLPGLPVTGAQQFPAPSTYSTNASSSPFSTLPSLPPQVAPSLWKAVIHMASQCFSVSQGSSPQHGTRASQETGRKRQPLGDGAIGSQSSSCQVGDLNRTHISFSIQDPQEEVQQRDPFLHISSPGPPPPQNLNSQHD